MPDRRQGTGHGRPLAHLRGMCVLVARDAQAAAAILLTQVRYASNVIKYMMAKRHDHGLENALEVLRTLEAEIQGAVIKKVEEAEKQLEEPWDEDGPKAYEEFGYHRNEAHEKMYKILGCVGPIFQSVRHSMYGRLLEYPAPSPFFGLDQQRITDHCSSVAQSYDESLGQLASRWNMSMPSHPTVSFEYIPFGKYHWIESRATEGTQPRAHTQVSAPVWHLYMPRYLPVLCHELAHPIAESLLRTFSQLSAPTRDFMNEAAETVGNSMGEAILYSLDNIIQVMARELLGDMLSIAVAGPAYALAWLASMLGYSRAGFSQEINLPSNVRVKIFRRVLERMEIQSPATDLLAEASEAYEARMAYWGFRKKLDYQRDIYKASEKFIDSAADCLGIGASLKPPASDGRWQRRVSSALYDISRLPQYEGLFQTDVAGATASWWRDVERSVPNLLWHLHLAEEARHGPGAGSASALPEGRIFARLMRPPLKSGFREGQYWELLGIKRHCARGKHEAFLGDWAAQMRAWAGRDPALRKGCVRESLGPFNFLALRAPLVAKEFGEYPPKMEGHEYYAARQLMVQLIAEDRESLDPSVASGSLMAMSEIFLEDGVDIEEVCRHFLDGWRGRCAFFRPLSTADVIVMLDVARFSDLAVVKRLIFETPRRIHSNTQLVLPESSGAFKDSGDAVASEGGGMTIRTFLRLAREESLDGLDRDAGRLVSKGRRGGRFERVMGPNDVEMELEVRSLEEIMSWASDLAEFAEQRGIANYDSRLGFPGEQP